MLLLYTLGLSIIIGIIIAGWYNRAKRAPELMGYIAGILIALGGMALVCVGSVALILQVGKETAYQEKLYERQVLVYRLENEDLQGNEMLYTQIVAFNNALRKEKRWSENEWVGCMYNEKIASMDYIEIKGMQTSGGD